MARNGSGRSGPDSAVIVARARQGERAALAALRATASDLGLGLVNVIWALNPEAVIVGGFFAPVWELVEQKVWEVLRSHMPAYMLAELRILPSRHADESDLLGALSLVFLQFFSRFEAGPTKPDSVSVQATG
jgi:predicted NBD/HSP70 family sugar kinase